MKIDYSGPKRIIFIAGLTHSGSTLLNILLGGTKELVGLGEVVPLLNHSRSKLQERERKCSCGNIVSGCPFWSRISRECCQQSDLDFSQSYSHLLAIFSEVFGRDKIPVDSSKSLSALRLVSAIPNVDITTIHMVRDVRGWLVSQRERDKRPRKDLDPEEVAIWRRTSLGRFLIWYYGNRRLIQFANGNGLRRILVSYEGLALRTEEVMTNLTQALDTRDAGSSAGESHVLLGNSMRLRDNRDVIRYDYRWLTRSDWQIPSLLLPGIMRQNQDWVYQSIKGSCRPD